MLLLFCDTHMNIERLPLLQCWITRCRLCYSFPLCHVLFHICPISRAPYRARHYWVPF